MRFKLKTQDIVFGNKLNEETLGCKPQSFVSKVEEISKKLQIIPDWLMVVMELETAGTFDPSITNALGYVGLIQFGEVAAEEVGTTQAELSRMTACEQIDYVYLFLKKHTGEMDRLLDVYLAVFFPIAVGKPLGWVLEARGLSAKRVASWNPLFDLDDDEDIQVWEVKRELNSRVPKKFKWII